MKRFTLCIIHSSCVTNSLCSFIINLRLTPHCILCSPHVSIATDTVELNPTTNLQLVRRPSHVWLQTGAVNKLFLCVCVCVFSEFRSPSHLSGLNRTASLSGADRTESLSISGSNSQLNNSIPSQQYTPDFYVRALTDLQFVKVGPVCYQGNSNAQPPLPPTIVMS